MMDHDTTPTLTLPEFTPTLLGFRADEFLTLTEALLAFPIEQDPAQLDVAPFRLDRPEPLPELPLPALPPRWYPRPAQEVIEAARDRLKPPPRPPIFEGRTNELARALRPLLSGNPVRICGEAGVGKTALLAHIAAHERTRLRFRRIWWFDRPDALDQTLALALNLPHVIADTDSAARRARLAEKLDDHTLLIIDNATPGDPALDHWTALTPNILIAVETPPEIPDPETPIPDDPEGVITLRGLDDAAAIDALARHAGIEDTRRLRGSLLGIVTALGHHPYALALAGVLARRDGLSLDELEELIALPEDEQSSAEDVGAIHELPPPPGDGEEWEDAEGPDAPAEARENASLNRALDVSLAALPRDYARLFEAFGAFPPDGAPFDGLQAVSSIANPLAARRGLIALEDYGFVRRDHRDPDHYAAHPVAWARAAAADDDPAQSKSARKMRAWALRYARAHHENPLALYRAGASLQHALAAEGDQALAGALRAYRREYVPGALVEIGDTEPELTGPRAEAATLTRYGIELTDQGAIYAAEEALNRALDLRRQHDSDHAIAETLVALGRLRDMNGHYDQARERLIEAAELVYRLGAEPSLSVIRRGLARVYRHMGQLNEALGVLDDAPEARFERAMVLRAQGHFAAAVEEMVRSGADAPYIRAETFLLAGRYDDALIAIADQTDADSAHLRAQAYHLQGRVEEALHGYETALECCEDSDSSSARAKILRGYGAALASARRFDAAREALEAALEIHRAEPSPYPARLGRTLRLLAAVHFAAGDVEATIATARDAVAQLRLFSAPDDAADAYRTLGRALWAAGDYGGALEAFSKEVEQAQSVTERDDARIGMALHHVADSYRMTGQLERAVANYRMALTHKKPAQDPTGTVITQLALHRALTESGRLPTALDVSQEILDHLTRRPDFDLAHYGYTQALRARTQQVLERPIRARQSLGEWTRVLAARADEAAHDPRPALRASIFGLAARSLLAENRPALALEVADRGLENAETHFPGTFAAWAARRDLGEAYLALGRAEEAIITLEPLLIDDVTAHPATYALAHELSGRAYRQIGDHDAALGHLRLAFEHEPDDHLKGLIQETMADTQLEIGLPSDAVESLRAALPLLNRADHPDAVARVLATLAHTLGGLNRYAEAIGVYEDALAALRDVEGVNPTYTADALRSLGRTHEAQGQLPEAAQAYRRALNLLQRADAPRQSLEILRLLARVTAQVGDPSAAQLYEQARDQTEQWGTVEELGEVLRELADVHRDAGRLPLAIQNYQAALARQPAPPLTRERIQTLRNLGRAYALAQRYDDARDAWTEALDLSRDTDSSPLEIALTHHAIGEAHRHQEHYTDAELSYREALSFHTPRTVEIAETWRALGRALHAAGRYADAIESLQKALEAEKAQPQLANARLVLTLHLIAAAQEANDNLGAAIARHHEALVYMDRTLQPVAYADTLRTLGRLYGDSRNYPQALVALNDALEIEGDHVPRSDERISRTLQAIADAYRASGDLEKAAEYYQKVTVYANMARRASDDLKATLDELERRRATLQAAKQSLALLDRSDNPNLKDVALIHALIAHSHARLNQPQDSADTIHTLLDTLAERHSDLSADDPNGDSRALAWLAAARRAEQAEDLETAQFACGSALESVRNADLRWLIEQTARAME